MSTVKQETVDNYLDYGMSYAAGIDKIKENNFSHSTTQGVIALLLMKLGYDELESYSAAVLMNMLSFIDHIKQDEINVALNTLVNTASNIIQEDRIPEHVKTQVAASLADKK